MDKDEGQPDPRGEMFSSYYFGDRPQHPLIYADKRQRMDEAEAKRVASLSWWRRWLEKQFR